MKANPRASEKKEALTPRQIFAYLDRYVVGQERAKRTIAIAAYNHLKRCAQPSAAGKRLIKKSNVLLLGPTGSGKTHIARTLARCLDVPFVVADATEYTEAGYYGKDVEVMIGELLHAADQDVDLAQRGIVFVDEVDKIARRSHGARTGAGARDIGGEGVQQGLLKMLEGREIFAPLNVTQHWNKHDFVVVDTQDILFVAAGTFSDLHLTEAPKPVGFGSEIAGDSAATRRVTEKELLDYGFLAEFLGRLPVRVELSPLGEDDLYLIMTGPPDAVVREYQALLKMDGVDLRFADEGLRAIAAYCIRRRTGARSLRTIVEEICHDVMFEAPERKGETVTIDADAVEGHLERLASGAAAGGLVKISDLFASGKRKLFSFEFFPPKTDAGQQALERTIRELAELTPAFVSVTYGAGGSTRSKTIELVRWIEREAHLTAMAHLTCVGASQEEIGGVVDRLVESGIDNVMVLRGDPPAGQEQFERTAGGFGYASDLVGFIRKRFGPRLCLGGAGNPEGHVECRDLDQDIMHLKTKVDAGLDFVVTQLFFDNRVYFDFVKRARTAGITVPIVPGLMPIRNVGGIERMTKLSGASIPAALNAELQRCRNDDAAVAALGIAQTTAQAVELLHGGAPGIHFYTLNQSPATRVILTALKTARLA